MAEVEKKPFLTLTTKESLDVTYPEKPSAIPSTVDLVYELAMELLINSEDFRVSFAAETDEEAAEGTIDEDDSDCARMIKELALSKNNFRIGRMRRSAIKTAFRRAVHRRKGLSRKARREASLAK